MRFLKRFEAELDNENALDKLIIDREKALKTAARSKLSNKELYQYDGNSINMEPLYYRLPNAQRIVQDIFEGVAADA
jgi:hypothetical protein